MYIILYTLIENLMLTQAARMDQLSMSLPIRIIILTLPLDDGI